MISGLCAINVELTKRADKISNRERRQRIFILLDLSSDDLKMQVTPLTCMSGNRRDRLALELGSL